jgi:hypothetical protein
MDQRTRNLFIGTLIAVVALVGGAAFLFGGTVNNDGNPVGPDPVTGVIVAVDSAGLSDVRGFTLRTDAADLIEFSLAQFENGNEFPPGHLAEHQATAEPVLVYWHEVDGTRFAIRILDAPA